MKCQSVKAKVQGQPLSLAALNEVEIQRALNSQESSVSIRHAMITFWDIHDNKIHRRLSTLQNASPYGLNHVPAKCMGLSPHPTVLACEDKPSKEVERLNGVTGVGPSSNETGVFMR